MNALLNFFVGKDPQPTLPDAAATVAQLPPGPAGVMISSAEVQRRGADAFDRACRIGDYNYLKSVAALGETKQTNFATGVAFACDHAQVMKDIYDWCVAEYPDCIDDVALQLTCRGNPTAVQIATAQQAFVAATHIDPSKVQRPVFTGGVSSEVAGESQTGITGILKITGRAFAALIGGLHRHIAAKAAEFQHPNDNASAARVTGRQRVSAYMVSVLAAAAPKHLPSSPAPAASLNVGQERGHGLNSDLVDSLSRRVELLKRRVGIVGGHLTEPLFQGVQGELTRAIKDTDPIDIAAAACILWEFGAVPKNAQSTLKKLVKVRWQRVDSNEGVTVVPPAHSPAVQPAVEVDPVKSTNSDEELLTTDELAARIKYDPRTIRERLKGRALIEGVHYVRPFGRKVLYRWSAVQTLMGLGKATTP